MAFIKYSRKEKRNTGRKKGLSNEYINAKGTVTFSRVYFLREIAKEEGS